MSYRQLLYISKWLVLAIAALTIQDAFHAVWNGSFGKGLESASGLIRSTALASGFCSTCLSPQLAVHVLHRLVLEQLDSVLLTLFFLATLVRYSLAFFWEFVPRIEAKGGLEGPVDAGLLLRFSVFATLQGLLLSNLSHTVASPIRFCLAAAALFLSDLVWYLSFKATTLFRSVDSESLGVEEEDSNDRAKFWAWLALTEVVLVVLLASVLLVRQEVTESSVDSVFSAHPKTDELAIAAMILTLCLIATAALDLIGLRDFYRRVIQRIAGGDNGATASPPTLVSD